MKVFFLNVFRCKLRFSFIGTAIFSAILTLTTIFPYPAWAQAATLSDIMCNAFINIGPFAPLLSAIAFIAGGILIGAGLLALKDHADSAQNNPVHKGVARIAFGSGLMTLPFVAQAL